MDRQSNCGRLRLHRTGDDSPTKLDHGQSVPAVRNLEDRVSSLEGSLSAFLLTMRELVQDVRCMTESLEVSGELDADVCEIIKPSLFDLERSEERRVGKECRL